MPYANNKDADQPVQPCSLISAFVVHCLDSKIPLVSYTQNFKPLPSFCGCAGLFVSYLVANPEDGFSRDVAHIIPWSSTVLKYPIPMDFTSSTHVSLCIIYANFYMSLVTRKPVFGVYDQVRYKPACSATATI